MCWTHQRSLPYLRRLGLKRGKEGFIHLFIHSSGIYWLYSQYLSPGDQTMTKVGMVPVLWGLKSVNNDRQLRFREEE